MSTGWEEAWLAADRSEGTWHTRRNIVVACNVAVDTYTADSSFDSIVIARETSGRSAWVEAHRLGSNH